MSEVSQVAKRRLTKDETPVYRPGPHAGIKVDADSVPTFPPFKDNRAEVEALIEGKVCIRGGSPHRISVGTAPAEGKLKPRCACYPEDPLIGGTTSVVGRRLGELMTTDIARRGAEFADMKVPEFRGFMETKATDMEISTFLQFCVAEELNPFTRDVYLIKYDSSKPASYVIGIDTYMRRADAHPDFEGFDSGIVVRLKDGTIENRNGSIKAEGEEILGGWADVHRKGRRVRKARVSFREFNTGQSKWKASPGYMIEKVAQSAGVRRQFPSIENTYVAGSVTVTVEDAEGQAIDVEGVAAGVDDLYGRPETANGPADKLVDIGTGEVLTDEPVTDVVEVPVAEPEPVEEPPAQLNIHPWLERCPEHGVEWGEPQEGRGGEFRSHQKEDGKWCTQKTKLSGETWKILAEKHGDWSNDEINAWVKTRYEGRTMSKLNVEEICEIVPTFTEYVREGGEKITEAKE
jgi:phage recombination protein Bet